MIVIFSAAVWAQSVIMPVDLKMHCNWVKVQVFKKYFSYAETQNFAWGGTLSGVS